MSIRIMTWVWDHSRSAGPERLVLLALADNANDEGECWPSIATIAAKTLISERSVQRHLRSLELRGVVVVEQVTGRSNRYRITCQEAESVTPDNLSPLTNQAPTPAIAVSPPPDKAVSPEPPVTVNEEPPVTPYPLAGDDDALPGLTAPKAVEDPESLFEAWWVRYPRKVNKGGARRAFKAARKKASFELLMEAVIRFEERCQRERREEQFIPHAQTWLNGERWLDVAEHRAERQVANGYEKHWAGGGGFFGFRPDGVDQSTTEGGR